MPTISIIVIIYVSKVLLFQTGKIVLSRDLVSCLAYVLTNHTKIVFHEKLQEKNYKVNPIDISSVKVKNEDDGARTRNLRRDRPVLS